MGGFVLNINVHAKEMFEKLTFETEKNQGFTEQLG